MEEIGIELECEEVVKTEVDDESEKFELVCDPRKLNAIESKIESFDFNIVLAETQLRPINERVRVNDSDALHIENFYEVFNEVEHVKQIYDNLIEDNNNDSASNFL